MTPPPRHIAVLGGGITGLSSAFYLSRRFPSSLITLIEKQKRLGGWVRTERVSHEQNELAVEAGPRTLRPTSKAILELVEALITTPRTSPAARSRFLYVPSLQSGLTSIPSSLFAFLQSPLSKIVLPTIFREPFLGRNRPQTSKDDDSYDESFESFLQRRFGPEFARVFGSSLCHGVYAADARELSTRAAFPLLFDLERQGGGSVVLGVLKRVLGREKRDELDQGYDMGDVQRLMRGVAVYSFSGGIQTLTDTLTKAIISQPNVEISFEGVRRIEMRENAASSLVVHTSQRSLEPSNIVSTLPLPILHSVLSDSNTQPLPHLTANHASSVTVISLVFDAPPHSIHPQGFGYLVPRPPEGYISLSSNTETGNRLGVLGTVFDSSSVAVDHMGSKGKYTKLTVMLGGPYPRSQPLPSSARTSDAINEGADLVDDVLSHLSETLQRPLPAPIESRIWHHVDCIPTLRIGHVERMKELRSVLQNGQGKGAWRGRMEVIGAGVGGVSVGDCVEAGRNVGAHW